jgi:hypothetical protein
MNFVSGVTVTDKGPPRGPGATAIETHLSGKIALPLHGKRGEVKGALLENGTVLRMPRGKPSGYKSCFSPDRQWLCAARAWSHHSALGRCSRDGSSADQLTQLCTTAIPEVPTVGPRADGIRPPEGGPDEAAPPPPRGRRG